MIWFLFFKNVFLGSERLFITHRIEPLFLPVSALLRGYFARKKTKYNATFCRTQAN